MAMAQEGPVSYKLYDYSLYLEINSKGWSKRARKKRTMIRKKGINTKCDTFGESVVRKRLLMRLISQYRTVRKPSFSLKALDKVEMIDKRPVKGSVKVLTA